MQDYASVAEEWRTRLRKGGYSYSFKNYRVLRHISRTWKKILSVGNIDIHKKGAALEVGSGGGKDLGLLLSYGWNVVGVDVSPEVSDRARKYLSDIKTHCADAGNYTLHVQDFFEYSDAARYDLVYHFGVIEHFLDSSLRLRFLKKMVDLTRPGGIIISVVPSGIHPLRLEVKRNGLGGYDISEVDYSPEMMQEEFDSCGVAKSVVLPHNIFGYLLWKKGSFLVRWFYRSVYYLVQCVPVSWWSKRFAERHAASLIGIAWKQSSS